MVRDPVCKMHIDEKRTVLISEYQGRPYFFCAPDCKRAFDKDPERFLAFTPAHTGDEQSHLYPA